MLKTYTNPISEDSVECYLRNLLYLTGEDCSIKPSHRSTVAAYIPNHRISTRRSALLPFVRLVQDKRMTASEMVTPLLPEEVQRMLDETGWRAATKRDRVRVFKQYLRWLQRTYKDPYHGLALLYAHEYDYGEDFGPQDKLKPLTSEEYHRILDTVELDKFSHAVILLMMDLGYNVGRVCDLRQSDIGPDSSLRTIAPLYQENALNALIEYGKERSSNRPGVDRMFLNPRFPRPITPCYLTSMIRKLSKYLGFEITPSRLRRTAIHHMVRSEVSPIEMSEILQVTLSSVARMIKENATSMFPGDVL